MEPRFIEPQFIEPQLIDRKILKKLLHRAYNHRDSDFFFNKTFKQVINIVKMNWFLILICISIIILLVHLYYKYNEPMINMIESNEDEQDRPSRVVDSYESEYYKMLPRVTNPAIIYE